MKRILALTAVLMSGYMILSANEKKAETPVPAKDAHVMAVPAEVKWVKAPASLAPGAMAAVLEGDPSKEGFFAMRLKIPAGYKIPPHFHPAQERVTVLEGTFSLGMGEKFNEAELKEYPAGSYMSMPTGMRHFAMSKDGATLQLATMGPWDITYINPTDDPRNQKTSK